MSCNGTAVRVTCSDPRNSLHGPQSHFMNRRTLSSNRRTGDAVPDTRELLQMTGRRRWTIVGLLFTASLINYFDRATISFALPLISTELHLGPESKGLLLSAFFWSYTLMQIPMGVLADRVNLRWLYAGAFTIWSMAQGLIGLLDGARFADRPARAARHRRIDLPAGRFEDRQPALPAGRARAAERHLRRRHAHGPGDRRRAGAVDADAPRLADQLLGRRLRGAASG